MRVTSFAEQSIWTVVVLLSLAVTPVAAQEDGGDRHGVVAHRDIAYVEGGHERQKLDLYVPENADGPLPLVLWVHGGGWAGGDKNDCPPLRAGYVDRAYAVASVGYRLSSHAPFPAQLEDCKAAIRWLRANGAKHNLDVNRFGVWGASAGGHLVALLGTTGDTQLFNEGPNPQQSSQVQAVCDFFGPTDLIAMAQTPGYESFATEDSLGSRLLGSPIMQSADKAARANPITYVSKGDAPTLIVHGDVDRLVPLAQSQLLFDALDKEGVSVRLHTIQGAGHGGPGFESDEVAEMIRDFFDENLKEGGDKDGPTSGVTESMRWRGRLKTAPTPPVFSIGRLMRCSR